MSMVSLRFSESELGDRRDRITSFIADHCETAGVSGVLIGLSGGVDSALTATLAVEALGPDNVIGLSLPAAVSADRHQTHADQLATQLEIEYHVIDIEPIVQSFDTAFPREQMEELTLGNTRARVRAVLSYALANQEARLVLGTGNRSETLVGYFTKYGDGAVDCHPIGNLYKLQVRQLARHVGVSTEIVEKTPTAELWADQSDEEELGIDYDTLDRILALHVDGPCDVTATAESIGCSEDTVKRVDRLVAQSEHKRAVPPTP